MHLINRLARPGEIRSIRVDSEFVVVRMLTGEVVTYRRVENENVPEVQLQYERRTTR